MVIDQVQLIVGSFFSHYAAICPWQKPNMVNSFDNGFVEDNVGGSRLQINDESTVGRWQFCDAKASAIFIEIIQSWACILYVVATTLEFIFQGMAIILGITAVADNSDIFLRHEFMDCM